MSEIVCILSIVLLFSSWAWQINGGSGLSTTKNTFIILLLYIVESPHAHRHTHSPNPSTHPGSGGPLGPTHLHSIVFGMPTTKMTTSKGRFLRGFFSPNFNNGITQL